MRDMKIAKKLTLSFAMVLIMLIIASGVALFGLNSVGKNLQDFYERPFRVTNRASEMQVSIQSAAKNIGYSMMTKDVEETKKYVDAAISDLDTLREDIEFMRENFRGDEALIDNFYNTMTESQPYREEVLNYAVNNENEKATEIYFASYQPLLVKALGELNAINDASMGNADSLYATANGSKILVFIVLIIVCVVAVVFTIVIALYLTKLLTNPIKEIEEAASKLSKGDLEIEIKYNAKDELGDLARSFGVTVTLLKNMIKDMNDLLEKMAGGNFNIHTSCEESYVGEFKNLLESLRTISTGLSDTMREINESTTQVSAASTQMADGASSLAEGATEQASAIEELLATVESVRNDVEASATQAEESSNIMSAIGHKTEDSSNQMKMLMDAMEKISYSSNQIAAIINTIEEIAEQTNLLSLNASIEAARAGDAGKGFAVVAGEIGKLAGQSGEAVNNTRTLIETALREVENGNGISERTAKSMFEVKDEIAGAVTISEQTRDAALQQSKTMQEINAGIEQISTVVQNNSATAEESSATSEELAAQAETLASLISKFKLREK